MLDRNHHMLDSICLGRSPEMELTFLKTSPAVPSSPSLRSMKVSLGFSASAGAGFSMSTP